MGNKKVQALFKEDKPTKQWGIKTISTLILPKVVLYIFYAQQSVGGESCYVNLLLG